MDLKFCFCHFNSKEKEFSLLMTCTSCKVNFRSLLPDVRNTVKWGESWWRETITRTKGSRSISVFLRAVVSLSITAGDKQLCQAPCPSVSAGGRCDGLGTEWQPRNEQSPDGRAEIFQVPVLSWNKSQRERKDSARPRAMLWISYVQKY